MIRRFFPILLLVFLVPAALRANKPCALIAGGSRGVGYAIAEALAKRGWDLVLIARHMDDLEKAKARLEGVYGIHVDILPRDLSQQESAEEIAAWCRQRNLNLRMLCNVAGFGGARDYLQLPPDTVRYMIRLNFESYVMLTYALLPLLEHHGPSYILNVASMAGFAPMPAKNIYSATKSAVIFFSYSLRQQLKSRDISVSCLSPGPVYTKEEVINTTRKTLGKGFGDWIEVPPARVGEVAVKRTLKKRMMIVPGTVANTASKVVRLLSKTVMARIYGSKQY